MTIPNHLDVVRAAKDFCIGHGIAIAGPCGALAITKRVAWVLKGEGAGLLDKPTGNQCDGFATDIVAYRDGDVCRVFDVLSDGGGQNGPTWNEGEAVDLDRWRPAVNPGDVPNPIPVPTPDPQPVPAPCDLSPVLQAIEAHDAGAQAGYQQLAGIKARLASLEQLVSAIPPPPAAYSGTVRLPFFGTVTIRLTPSA